MVSAAGSDRISPPHSPKREKKWVNPAVVDPRYWVVHGITYDLSSFVKSHPGGEYIIQLGQGRDCTELFESVHALADIEKARKILAKYEVKDIPRQENTDHFLWEEDGFYSVLRQRVVERFKGRNYKATWFVWFKLITMISLYTYCYLQAAFTGNLLWAAGAGIITEMVGFCMMHGSSHNAFSKKPILNYLGLLWAPWMIWNHWTWLQHHVYGHHSYTGLYGMDPDLHNLALILRKHFKSEETKTSRFQHLYIWPLLLLIPGQHIGQILLYPIVPLFTKDRIFITPFIKAKTQILMHAYLVMFLSLCFHLVFPLYYQSVGTVACMWLTMLSMMGISYFMNVLPNHDTESVLQNHPTYGIKNDWGEQQVRCTGNHSVTGSPIHTVISQLWGGMNYQIEHHLFPALNHTHYHEVSLIVQETAKEFGIPYVAHSNWLGSVLSFNKFLYVMAKIPGAEQYRAWRAGK